MAVLFWCIYLFRLDVSHPGVELEKAETTSTSTNIRTTASSPLRYLSPAIRFLTLFLTSYVVELAIAEMACVS